MSAYEINKNLDKFIRKPLPINKINELFINSIL